MFDCLLYREIKNNQDQIDMQRDLDALMDWGSTWGMKFNAKNCNIMRVLVLVLVYTQEGSLWSIVLRCDDHTGIFTCDGCARDPYFYVPAETQSYVIKLSCSRKVLAASGD